MSTPPTITSHLIPMDEDDIARNIQRIVVEVPRSHVGHVDSNLLASGGWCAPSQTIYDIATPIDYNEVAAARGYRFPRGGVTFTVPNVSPQVVGILTGTYVPQEETLL